MLLRALAPEASASTIPPSRPLSHRDFTSVTKVSNLNHSIIKRFSPQHPIFFLDQNRIQARSHHSS